MSLMGHAFRDGHWRLLPAAVLVLSGAAMVAGIGFLFLAWRRVSLPYGVTGVGLLLAAPPLAVVAMVARASVPQRPDAMRAHDLIDGIHHMDSTLRMIRRARAHLGVAAASTLLAWICEASRLTDFLSFALCSTLMVAIAAAGCLPWFARQERIVQEQREVQIRWLAAIRIAEKWFAG
jgi:hypothetical protein